LADLCPDFSLTAGPGIQDGQAAGEAVKVFLNGVYSYYSVLATSLRDRTSLFQQTLVFKMDQL